MFVRLCALSMCIGAGPAIAQTMPPSAPGNASAATQRPDGPDIIVRGQIGKKRGTWKRAESDHIVIIGTDSAADLNRLSRNFEDLYALLSRLYHRGEQSGDIAKMQITLIDSADAFRAMDLGPQRASQSQYPPTFAAPSYDDARVDGDVLAVAKTDQLIDLNTTLAYHRNCEDAIESGAFDCIKSSRAYIEPAVRSWESTLYALFAQRFVQTYKPAAYPAWYIDGIGALFATVSINRDGAIDYASPPPAYAQVFRSYGEIDVAGILEGRTLNTAADKARWTPYHAWLLAHYFVFSTLKAERRQQFHDYMLAVAQGTPMGDAAKTFGDMRALQRDVLKYRRADKTFARAAAPEALPADPVISTLSPASAALVEARIALSARLAAPPNERAGWLAQVHTDATRLPEDDQAILFAAEAECRGGATEDCLADAERVLTGSPDNVAALTWKGVALTDRAVSAPVAERAAMLTLARTTIDRAIAIDDASTPALVASFQSFTKAGERVPDTAMAGMARAIRLAPGSPAPRLYLAEELLRQGNRQLALRLVHVVLYGPYDSPEKSAALALFGTPAGAGSASR